MERAIRAYESPRPRVRPPKTRKTAMVVAQRIVDIISKGDFPPGTQLPAEKEMLAQYNVGRGTLRESLRFLKMNGVIAIKPGPGGGPVVSEPDSRYLAGSLGLFLQLYGAPFRQILEVRLTLEPMIAAHAAEHVSAEHLDRLRLSVETMAASIGDEERFLDENENFHELVAWASGNAVFGMLISSMHWITDGSVLGVGYPVKRQKAVLAAHRRIYEAIASRDPEVARRAMEDHIGEFAKYLERYYPAVCDAKLNWSAIAP